MAAHAGHVAAALAQLNHAAALGAALPAAPPCLVQQRHVLRLPLAGRQLLRHQEHRYQSWERMQSRDKGHGCRRCSAQRSDDLPLPAPRTFTHPPTHPCTWYSLQLKPLCQIVLHQAHSLVSQAGQTRGLSGAGSASSTIVSEQRGLGQSAREGWAKGIRLLVVRCACRTAQAGSAKQGEKLGSKPTKQLDSVLNTTHRSAGCLGCLPPPPPEQGRGKNVQLQLFNAVQAAVQRMESDVNNETPAAHNHWQPQRAAPGGTWPGRWLSPTAAARIRARR